MQEASFLCNSDPHGLVTSFIGALESLALQSIAIIKNLPFDIKTVIKSKLSSIWRNLPNVIFEESQQIWMIAINNKICTSTQFLQIQKKQLIDQQELLERYCIVLAIIGFNSVKYDLNLINSCLLPNLVIELNIEPTVIKNSNQFKSFKFGDIQLLGIMNFLGGSTSLDYFLKAYKTSETEGFFPYQWFDHPHKIQNPELPPYDPFYSKLRSCEPLETEYVDYRNLLKSGLTTKQAVTKLKLSEPPLLELRFIIICIKIESKIK